MAQIGKNFVFAVAFIVSISSSAVASLDSSVFDLEMKRYDLVEHRAFEKTRTCDKFEDDIAYRDCLIDAAVFALSARDSKNDGVGKVFEQIFSKIDESLKLGAALLIAQRAVDGFKSSSKMTEQATYYEILKNLMNHLKGEKDDYSPVYEHIKNAKIEASEEMINARLHKMALKTEDLTEKADMLLNQAKAIAKVDTASNAIEVSE
jgi:hypothetical protein